MKKWLYYYIDIVESSQEEKKLEWEDGDQEWTKHTTEEELINIGTIVGLSKNQPRYYVNMPRIPTIWKHPYENMVENWE
jgi:hypothetical protein